ncbi:MAG: Hsp70 family protein, partial [Planctomycetota bacterium]
MGYVELNVLNNEVTKVAIGIDLGTTNSLCAVMHDGHPEILRSETEGGSVPSVLHFGEDGEVTVGHDARSQAVADPLNTLFSVKRF